ncbi:DMT family transporter [Zhengella sp. ZM62]|uniref:DMT family transporter n=1 Tax=Zhengella sedimenti TaxID=3390035 RepID=UPI0039767FE5
MTIGTGSAMQGPTMSARNWAELLILGLVWGAAFFFGRIAVGELHPLVLVFLRVVLAAFALHAFLSLTGRPFRADMRLTGQLLILALFNNVIPFSLIFTGQTELGAGLASVINATTPFWTVIAAQVLTSDEKISANKLAGIGLGVAGATILVGPSALAGIGGPAWAKFAVMGATVSYALAAIFARRLRGVAPAHIAAGQLSCSALMMLPAALLLMTPDGLMAVSAPVWASVVALALLSTAFAYILYFRIVASAGATNASLVTLVVPASAIVLGAVFLGEAPEPFELAGLALIATGLVTIDGRLLRRR